jgi:mono/diheme cytochrome c family protein
VGKVRSFAPAQGTIDPKISELTGPMLYNKYCSACHGGSGQGDGPLAEQLPVKPRDLFRADWQESVDNEYLKKLLRYGGASVSLSTAMPGFGSLFDQRMEGLIAHIRSFKQQPAQQKAESSAH